MLILIAGYLVLLLLLLVAVVRLIALFRCCSVHCEHTQQQWRQDEILHATSTNEGQTLTIIKPLKGLDAHTEFNLSSFFAITTPQICLSLCIESYDDPVAAVVERLLQLYPTANVKVYFGSANIGVNPKINNMYQAYQEADSTWIWISDANLCTSRQHIEASLHQAQTCNGVLHHLPLVLYRHSFAGLVEEAYFATQHAYLYAFADALRINGFNGMSTLFRKATLEQLTGGLAAFKDYLAEDFVMAQALYVAGCRHRMGNKPAVQDHETTSLHAVFTRMVRWLRLRRGSMPAASFLEILIEPLPLYLLTLLTFPSSSIGVTAITATTLVWLVYTVIDIIMLCMLQGLHRRSLQEVGAQLLACWLRELLAVLAYVVGHASNVVEWRGRQFKVGQDGKTEPLQEHMPAKSS